MQLKAGADALARAEFIEVEADLEGYLEGLTGPATKRTAHVKAGRTKLAQEVFHRLRRKHGILVSDRLMSWAKKAIQRQNTVPG